MKAKVGQVSWIDLTVKNAEQVRDSYKEVVCWKTTEVNMGGYSDYNMNLEDGKATASLSGNACGPDQGAVSRGGRDVGIVRVHAGRSRGLAPVEGSYEQLFPGPLLQISESDEGVAWSASTFAGLKDARRLRLANAESASGISVGSILTSTG